MGLRFGQAGDMMQQQAGGKKKKGKKGAPGKRGGSSEVFQYNPQYRQWMQISVPPQPAWGGQQQQWGAQQQMGQTMTGTGYRGY